MVYEIRKMQSKTRKRRSRIGRLDSKSEHLRCDGPCWLGVRTFDRYAKPGGVLEREDIIAGMNISHGAGKECLTRAGP